MSRIKVQNEVHIYERDGKDVAIGSTDFIGIESHWNRREFVVLKIGAQTVTVVGRDLKAAIDNAMNTGAP